MEQSILKSVKKILGIGEEDTSFDLDIITHINSAFSVLTQLGIGPEEGFWIEDDETEWEEFVDDDPLFIQVRTYVYLKTRIAFDPPTTSYLIGALTDQIREHEQRLSQIRESIDWEDPDPVVVLDE